MKCCWPDCERLAWPRLAPLCLGHINDVVTKHRDWVDGLPEAPPPRKNRPGSVYFLVSDGLWKIGWTKDLQQRMRAYPPSAQVYAVMPGYRADETRLHKGFGHLLARGREWFRPDPSIDAMLQRLVEEHGAPEVKCGPVSEWKHGR